MNPLLGAPTVLIVDEDVGFVWWLGEIFHEIGCRAVPALDCREALSRAEAANLGVDLLVVNPNLMGVPALIQGLRRLRLAKIVAIRLQRSFGWTDLDADAVLERPSAGEPISRAEWIRRVRAVLAQIGTRAAS